MATKLKSLFRAPRSTLLLRTLFFGLLLIFLREAVFAFPLSLFFIAVSAWLFFGASAAGKGYGASFAVLAALIAAAGPLMILYLPGVIFAGVFTLFFGMLLGARMLIFPRRPAIAIFTWGMAYFIFLAAGLADPWTDGFGRSLVVWLCFFFIFRDLFETHEVTDAKNSYAAVFAFVALEAGWIAAFLPFTAFAGSVFAFASTFGAWEIFEWYRAGKISKTSLFWIAAIMCLVIAALISTSSLK